MASIPRARVTADVRLGKTGVRRQLNRRISMAFRLAVWLFCQDRLDFFFRWSYHALPRLQEALDEDPDLGSGKMR